MSKIAARVVRRPVVAGIAVAVVLLSPGALHGGRGAEPKLTGSHPCPGARAFTCSELTVPLDLSGRVGGTLRLEVAEAKNASARKGVLLVLTGGPGQPGTPFASELARRLRPLLDDYRLVMLDQRGTGDGALVCPVLQAQMGASDLRRPTAAAVRACAATIGPRRRFYTTLDTVADLERLRRALGVDRWVVDGTSYGSYVAERYGLAHPRHTAKLVLDSVVPQDGIDMLSVASMHAAAGVLRDVCRRRRCGYDPAADLARVVRRHRDGPALLDALVLEGIVDPTYTTNADIPSLLHSAAHGDVAPLDGFVDAVVQGSSFAASQLSQGLHASTLCTDQRGPWGASSTTVGSRRAAVERAVARLSSSAVYPFDRRTAQLNGFLQTCLYWPATRPALAPAPGARLLPPTLILAGGHDLSTPIAWARHEATLAPHSRLVVVPPAGHAIQTNDASGRGLRALRQFLGG